MYPPKFDELYVISDLHMGGRKNGSENFQVFNQGPRLASFIRHIIELRPDDEVALVLNGDVFDSLAEDEVSRYIALDQTTATRMMEHLYSDASFKPVWDALNTFIITPRRHLIFVIGNHDIELSLPVVEGSIRQRLAGNDRDAWSRISFAAHGGGFACQVGHARVFCSHGNELDPWNWVDYSALGQLANAINAGRIVKPAQWKPNAGTRLVVDVMNQIKRRFPFVDLLKPETAAVTSILMVLDRELMNSIDLSDAYPIWRDKRRGNRATNELLGAYAAQIHSSDSTNATPDELADKLLGSSLRRAIESRRKSQDMSEDELLLDAEREGGTDAEELAAGDELETLGAWDMVTGWVGLVSRPEALRRALKDWLDGDQTFAINYPKDELFQLMKDRIANTVDFVVTGHTHQPRAMSYEGGCYYYNCGTWIRRLRLTPQILDDNEAFEKKLWPALIAGRMDALDKAKIPGPKNQDVPLLFDQTNAVRIVSDGDKVIGDLLRITDAEDGGVDLIIEEGTNSFHVS